MDTQPHPLGTGDDTEPWTTGASLHWPSGTVVALTAGECTELLDSQDVGRVAWCHGGRPHLVPVNYDHHDGRVRLRTSARSRLATAAGVPIVFEVDQLDPFTRSGTSVLVEGEAQRLHLPRHALPETWGDDSRLLVLEIRPRSVTGRRVMPS